MIFSATSSDKCYIIRNCSQKKGANLNIFLLIWNYETKCTAINLKLNCETIKGPKILGQQAKLRSLLLPTKKVYALMNVTKEYKNFNLQR